MGGVFQTRVPAVPQGVPRPFGVAWDQKGSALLRAVSCLPREFSSPPTQCVKCVSFPPPCLHVCLCSVLPAPGVAFLPSPCPHSDLKVPFGAREHRRRAWPACTGQWRRACGPAGARPCTSLKVFARPKHQGCCIPPSFPGEGGDVS